ncbi:MAG: CotH kinase family protein [Prevotellaceae bacterium]|nr:CotH kinase family protein [Prevotellaceae bacterium]
MKEFLRTLCLSAVFLFTLGIQAQDWFRVSVHDMEEEWHFPYRIEHVPFFEFNESLDTLKAYRYGPDEAETGYTHIPFAVSSLDSISFFSSSETFMQNRYKVFAMNIVTEDMSPVDSKEQYVPCYISIDGKGEFPDYSGSARIRGRGNSTWLWYPKKPYRIKLDVKDRILGLKKNKDWVLLANYRDPTDLMNTFAFETAQWLNMPFTNHTRYVEVFLNTDYIGLYQLTEQVEQGSNRVDISEEGGVLLSFDLDDGPDLSPSATDNFYSEVYKMPMCIKFPDNPTEEQISRIRSELSELEAAVKEHDYEKVSELMDMQTFISMLQLQEYLYNVDFTAPRSVYMFRDAGGKYTMGPVWDWDAGYDFDWGSEHDFFASYRKLMMGTDPLHQNGAYSLPRFFTDMFGSSRFVSDYKEAWNRISSSIFTRNWAECEKFVDCMNEGAFARDSKRWYIGKKVSTEISKMKSWLSNRADYMTTVINSYPLPMEKVVVGKMEKALSLRYADGYKQSVTVDIDMAALADILGITQAALLASDNMVIVPLMRDGSEGANKTNGVFGGWFDANGEPYTWNSGHVYIEVFDDLFSWNCGVRTDAGYCVRGHKHTVTMQYQYRDTDCIKAVNVEVTFTVE